MAVECRHYLGLEDFIRVGEFLVATYQGQPGPNWLQPRWEYMHFHPNLDLFSLQQIGIWEDDGRIVAVVHHEDALGDAYFEVHSDYHHLKPEMLLFAEQNLAAEPADGKRRLRLFVHDFDTDLQSQARAHGYQCLADRPQWNSILSQPLSVAQPVLPRGFRLQSLADENDLRQVDRCLWRGPIIPGSRAVT